MKTLISAAAAAAAFIIVSGPVATPAQAASRNIAVQTEQAAPTDISARRYYRRYGYAPRYYGGGPRYVYGGATPYYGPGYGYGGGYGGGYYRPYAYRPGPYVGVGPFGFGIGF